ncbi:aminopeptidase [Lysinibacillus xylanilyticus]|uniref:aminopeptidase n=1 Tax=Lysinibacillus xylanilyticus TaxID=582475 RepID=UPI003D08B6C5
MRESKAAAARCFLRECEAKAKGATRNGLYRSLIHVDFMIGSKQLNIDGITTDRQIDLFTTRVTR